MYAIIDIETTGGSAANSRITEIAILLHDGQKVVEKYATLINPECNIPYYITRITGISNEMVAHAPRFHEIAKKIVELTQGAVFVAHNVNFDYSFVRAAFKDLGYNYSRKTLCTVRLSRSAFPGLPSYSLGNLCKSLHIEIKDRHRAMGDAEATTILFGKIIAKNGLPDSLKGPNSVLQKTSLPPNLSPSVMEKLPLQVTGVYYFHNTNGDILYIGKSKNIRKRVLQHFTSAETKKAVQMQDQIADISFESTGSELVALLLESEEIKRLKPIYNAAQKRVKAIPVLGIFHRFDAEGYLNFYVKTIKADDEPLLTADNMHAIRELLYGLIDKYQLCLSKCELYNLGGPCFDHQLQKCRGACIGIESAESYNRRAENALGISGLKRESFFVCGEGRNEMEKSLVLVENGIYKGFGFIDAEAGNQGIDVMKSVIKKSAHNADIAKILKVFLTKGHKKIPFFATKETGY